MILESFVFDLGQEASSNRGVLVPPVARGRLSQGFMAKAAFCALCFHPIMKLVHDGVLVIAFCEGMADSLVTINTGYSPFLGQFMHQEGPRFLAGGTHVIELMAIPAFSGIRSPHVGPHVLG